MILEDESTNKSIALRNEIVCISNGSHLYGLNTEESDNDILSIFIEPELVVWSNRSWNTFNLRTPHQTTNPGDLDGYAYSLRHYIKLATQGNPSILTTLFADSNSILHIEPIGHLLFQERDLFVSQNAAPRFRGYLLNQIDRFRGIKQGHKPKRPHLVEAFGYDTKYAMHIYRLGLQGIEFLSNGHISCPMFDEGKELCLDIRSGSFTYDEVNDGITQLLLDLDEAISLSELPLEPDYDDIASLSAQMHYEFWDSVTQ